LSCMVPVSYVRRKAPLGRPKAGYIFVPCVLRLTFSMEHANTRPIVAIDCDEVLAQFVPALAEYHNSVYGTSLSLADFCSYRFSEVWGGTDTESILKVHQFFESPFFKNLKQVPGALDALKSLQSRFRFVVVTSRQHVIENATREWIELNFPDIFEDVLFGNHWTKDAPDPDKLDSTKRTKLEMCQAVGAIALVDDAPSYVQQCASTLQKVILFGNYGWNTGKSVDDALPVGVNRAVDWIEACRMLNEL